MKALKKYLIDIAAVVLFVVISFAYFFPADIDGRILYRHDSSAGRGAGIEMSQYTQKTGEVTRWTNSLFSGMPTYQMAPSYKSGSVLNQAEKAYHLWLPENVWFLFAYLLGFYILLRAFDFRKSLAVLGSVIWAFSSYFLIIIAAGHLWKVMALAYLPPMMAGVVLAFRGKLIPGFIITAIFTAFEVNANHVQMTYYYLFIILFMVIAYLVTAIREKTLKQFWKAVGVCAAAAILGICINLSNLYHTWQYGQESMRGKSELVKKNAAVQTNSGLDRDYITQWSYGIDETWTLLVPNTKGGASVPLAANRKAMEKADPNFMQIYQQLGQYWGDQPGTSGPVYVGAFVLMLFILGLFIVKGPMKWALLAATILSILLSWGRNFMPFTDFFLDYVPMYSKFRTVASILVIAEFTIPLLAIMALKEVVENPDVLARKMKYVYISFALTAGIALLFALMPGVFFSNFISVQEQEAFKSIPSEYLAPLTANLNSIREGIFTADCWRSFWIIVLGTALIFLYKYRKLRADYVIGLITVLCFIDMWQVDKRYLNDEMFVEKSVRETPKQMTATDRQILQDKSLDYRVLNLASNTFNENETSYFHKSIGGYHAAKLRRYQEMIEAYIHPEMQKLMAAVQQADGDMTKVNGDSIFPVLNMLNAKYFILPLQGGQTVPLQNPYVYGNGWFVDRLDYVDSANQELNSVGKLDLRHHAVADRKFEKQLGKAVAENETALVELTAYEPNKLTYQVKSDKGGVVVFSEVYYPGWQATVDGKSVELGRVNYILRAINVQPGSHQVVLSFYPKSVARTETVAYVAYAILLVMIGLAVYFETRKKKTA
ncbi:membrane protein YfhO domain protein [Segatella baroniae F0067]|uniref:Membrane protein YfhO domain protein n=1 Tax=Segatella baroniae F0067 TaxID=1115809 RepID=U2NPK8_9BACT|nr:YfhO family protein [Segatella baroniae]ERK39965.1 membrane protein YfhO domain protein [Segatella baroniae F0067]